MQPPTSCRRCKKDAEEEERRKQKAFELKEKRERAEREHNEQLLKLNEQIELRTQDERDRRLAHERQITLQQRQKDLENVNGSLQRPSLSHFQVPSPQGPSDHATLVERGPRTTGPTGKLSTFYSPTQDLDSLIASPSLVEWERLKSVEKACNGAIDSLMEMVGLEDVKAQVLGIKAKIDVSQRQNSDVKDERFNINLLGNPGTGELWTNLCLFSYLC